MQVVLINPIFSPDNGQGYVNLRLAAFLASAGVPTHLIGSVPPEEWRSLPGISHTPLSIPKRLPALLRYRWIPWAATRVTRPFRSRADTVVIANGNTLNAPHDLNLFHFVHAGWLDSPFHPGRSGFSLNAIYQRSVSSVERFCERSSVTRARHLVAVSESVKNDLMQHYPIQTSRIAVIPNGIDCSRAFRERSKSREKLSELIPTLTKSDHIALFAGGISTPRKNAELAIRTMPLLPSSVHLVIAGENRFSRCHEAIAQSGANDRIHLLGHRDDVKELYAGADVSLLPSHYEPFGLVALESMASGTPVIVSGQAGASQLIEPNHNGWVLKELTDPQILADQLNAIFADPELLEKVRKGALETAAANDWNLILPRYLELIHKIFTHRQVPLASLNR